MSHIKVEAFPSLEGDCILISLGDNSPQTHILIDGGFKETYEKYLKKRLLEMSKKGEKLSLVVVSHIDSDHIEGILELFKENESADNPIIIHIEEVWHNSYRHLQADILDNSTDLGWQEQYILEDIITKATTKISHDSNEDKDISAEQGSSLAALLYKGKYKWNNKFNGKAISNDNQKYIKLNADTSIYMLSPNNKKLEKLKDYWLNELQKLKHDFKLTNDKLFDDAYEFYLMEKNEEEANEEIKEISFKQEEKDLGNYLMMKDTYDSSVANGSSISFILEYKGRKMLFLGDSHHTIIKEELVNLKEEDSNIFFDLIKVSHHGSKNNTSKKLLEIIDSNIYLISTNGGRNKHPDKETIAKIVCRQSKEKRNIVFNYFQDQIWNDEHNKEIYNFNVFYPSQENSITISYGNSGIKVE
ncbi:AVAST type 1 anti-phage system MBL fold metallo-hydrolase Avs1a [Psychrobacillus psychrodurans]|uniref:AVAST type 1 anti-phage system MBL fold metallo-hydrolase Avs1a n=1 Tax=Psychrobacillus psychrodurans TaxID=126157 RepID=UPI003CFCE3A6